MARRAFFSGKFQEVEAAVLDPDRALFPADVFTEDAFLWAVAVVRCRVHAPLEGDQLALVPLADLVGFSPGCSAARALLEVKAR